MKKIILNKCYGGFDVSPEAVRLYAKKKGLNVFFYDRHFESDTYVKIDEPSKPFFVVVTKDFGDQLSSNGDLHDFWGSQLYLSSDNREDPTLIEVVEELGEKASTRFSELIVVEIPDDVAEDYIIDDYDGIEILHKRVDEY